MKRKAVTSDNYLDRKPMRTDQFQWETDDSGMVTILVENKGIFNKIAQILLKKPKISYVHLDEMGSFIWPLLDGEKTIMELGEEVEKKFGDTANPLYERLVSYIRILGSYKFIKWNE